MELADLIISSSDSEKDSGAGPDPSADPKGALAHHRSEWPLNQKVSDNQIEVPDGSDRIRLRKVIAALTDSGYSVSGAERSSHVRGAQISFSAYFDRSGSCPRVGVTVADEISDALGIIQQALQAQGFGAVVTMGGEIAVIDPGDDAMTRYNEAGGIAVSYYGRSTVMVEPEELLVWRGQLPDITPNTIVSWQEAGCDLAQAVAWSAEDIDHPYEVKSWIATGRTPKQAKEWREAGLAVHSASHWIAAGRTPAEGEEWVSAGLTSYASAVAWEQDGFDADGAAPYLRLRGCSEPSDVQLLIDNKVSISDIAALADAGITTAEIRKVGEWTNKYKIEVPEAIEWAKLGGQFIGPGRRGRWHKAGYTPQEIELWQAAIGKRNITLDEVKALKASGYDPQAASDWADIHPDLARSEVSARWIESGLAPDEAEKWVSVNERFVDYRLVEGWMAAGLGPREAKPWAEANPALCDYKIVDAWQQADPRCSDPKLVAKLMGLTNPGAFAEIVSLLD